MSTDGGGKGDKGGKGGKGGKGKGKKGGGGGAAGAAAAAASSAGGGPKKGDKSVLGVTHRKEDDHSGWYHDVIFRAELVANYPVSGCYVLRPDAYEVWEHIQAFMDAEIKARGVRNTCFPMFVTEDALTREKDHVEGFAAEVAWITRYGNTEMPKPIALRPTSETVMYPHFADWIQSHRDLPLKVNQWCNVVRWEFSSATPFLRTREFLWQEGHTAWATRGEAVDEVYDILDLYARTYRDVLAVPVVKGVKSDHEKFAGGDFTTTVEGYVPVSGRGIQGGTSHHLGQNFGKMFNVVFENANREKEVVYQNSWGFSTRSIGVMIMVHSDNKGLVLPPRVAPLQAVFMTVRFKDSDDDALFAKCDELAATLRAAGVRTAVDKDTAKKPGFTRTHYELKGVPLRIEVGPRDMDKRAVLVCRRDTGAKESVAWTDLVGRVAELLDDVHASLYARALAERDEHIVRIDEWAALVPALDKRNLVTAPWCDETQCELDIKKKSADEAKQYVADGGGTGLTGACKTLCKPLDGELPAALLAKADDAKCFHCGKPAKCIIMLGRSY